MAGKAGSAPSTTETTAGFPRISAKDNAVGWFGSLFLFFSPVGPSADQPSGVDLTARSVNQMRKSEPSVAGRSRESASGPIAS